MFHEHFLNFVIAWFRSRKWLPVVFLGLLVGCLPITAFALVIAGMSTSRQALASSYNELIDAEMAGQDGSDLSQPSDTSNRNLQVPLRRILQMDAASERIKFYVAYELAQQGRISMAERMMREIAPVTEAGYPEAHAWLAAYSMTRRLSGDEIDLRELTNDLQVAINSSSTVTPQMIVGYAALLENDGRTDEALALLRSRSQQFPSLNVPYAELARKHEKEVDLKRAIRDGRESLESRFKSGEGGEVDIVQLVRLALLDDDFDEAISVTREAVSKNRQSEVYRRLYSDALIAKYLALGETVDFSQRMPYLDAAFQAYPSNERVVAELTKAIAEGVAMPKKLRVEVEEILADGNAPAVAHLILANSKLAGENPDSAIVHLELALRQMPNSAVIKNNLAVALLEARPDEIDRAEQLVEEALSQPGSTAKMVASMLDSQGQIRVAKEDLLGAIESFEKAIRLDVSKVNTRHRLADCYDQVGMSDLAAVQKRRIKELTIKGKAGEGSREL